MRAVRLIPGLKRALAPKEITLELIFLQPNQQPELRYPILIDAHKQQLRAPQPKPRGPRAARPAAPG